MSAYDMSMSDAIYGKKEAGAIFRSVPGENVGSEYKLLETRLPDRNLINQNFRVCRHRRRKSLW